MPHMDEDNPLSKDLLEQVLEEDLGIPLRISAMRWVVKYTAVAKKRGVIENKGYIESMAHLTIDTLYQRTWSSGCRSLEKLLIEED